MHPYPNSFVPKGPAEMLALMPIIENLCFFVQ